jgi:hypothetical protein
MSSSRSRTRMVAHTIGYFGLFGPPPANGPQGREYALRDRLADECCSRSPGVGVRCCLARSLRSNWQFIFSQPHAIPSCVRSSSSSIPLIQPHKQHTVPARSDCATMNQQHTRAEDHVRSTLRHTLGHTMAYLWMCVLWWVAAGAASGPSGQRHRASDAQDVRQAWPYTLRIASASALLPRARRQD